MTYQHKDTPESFRQRMCMVHGHDWPRKSYQPAENELALPFFKCKGCGAYGLLRDGKIKEI